MTDYIVPPPALGDGGVTPGRRVHLPELLAPAGSPEALDAALAAGADAVYLGGSRFNARMNAHNFDPGQLREAVSHAHHMGGRVYLTLNTQLWDRELSDAVAAAYEAAVAGVDALIIADLGAAALIRRALPRLPLHASTQLSGHNARMGKVLASFGFSRFVIARETCLDDLAAAVRENPLEVEVFVHGAMCVSHSGQCLFSSLVGGRSGNRGECAQPCRLPYGCVGCGERGKASEKGRRAPSGSKNRSCSGQNAEKESYPLSLKDLSLAGHVPALIETGVSSLKIEGRMKSPGYVSGVVAIWRQLLDEGRAATGEEMQALAALFSRDGFTDGYQTRRIDRRMMGIRREADKERTAAAEKDALAVRHTPHLPLSVTVTAKENQPLILTAEAPLYRQGEPDPHIDADTPAAVSVTLLGDVPAPATGQALTGELVEKQFSRTGGTPYRLAGLCADIGKTADGQSLFLPPSRLNALRRELVDRLDAARREALPNPAEGYTPPTDTAVPPLVADLLQAAPARSESSADTTARFTAPTQITPTAASYFDILYLPLGQDFPSAVPLSKRGYLLPPVIFDRDADAAVEALAGALARAPAGAPAGALAGAPANGVRHFLVGNLGHISLLSDAAERAGTAADELVLHGDLRLGVTNTPSLARMLSLGFSDVLLSPELTLPRMRDIVRAISRPASAVAVVYGRLPLMLLEKCAIREIYRDTAPAAVCRDICAEGKARLTDRMGKQFPVLREDFPHGTGHRNVVYNSLPLSMSDRPDELAGAEVTRRHFLFSVESSVEVDAVIEAYRTHRPLPFEVRRMVK